MASRCLLRPFECGGEISLTLYSYTRIYAAQIVLLTLLSAVTIYRREMSCNHVYQHDVKNTNNNDSESNKPVRDTQEGKEWDEVLEGADKWGSGKVLTEIIVVIWSNMMKLKEKTQNTSTVWTEDMSDELLEGAGLSLSGEPFWSAVLSLWTRIWITSLKEHERYVAIASSPSPFSTNLSPDTQVHILSFLHPKDITSFACCNKECKDLVDNPTNDTCLHLWKTLWDRDYAWLVQEWRVGIEASSQSNRNRPIDKQLYFEFGQTFINYLLVGRNTMHDCLVGLQGNIYDITDFLETHPGSPETLLVHAGQDATRSFNIVGHSISARALAASFCVVLDLSCYAGYCGAHPVAAVATPTKSICEEDVATITPLMNVPLERNPRRSATLVRIQDRLKTEERLARRSLSRVIPSNILGDPVVYYDAFDRKWKAWFTDDTFQTRRLQINQNITLHSEYMVCIARFRCFSLEILVEAGTVRFYGSRTLGFLVKNNCRYG